MGESIALGPVLLPTQALLLVVASAIALGVLGLFPETPGAERRRAETRLFVALVIGVLAARLAWVLRHWDAYAESPGAVLAIRDGGYLPLAGLLAAALVVLVLAAAAGGRRRTSGDKAQAHDEHAIGGNPFETPLADPAAADARLRRRQLLIPGGAAMGIALAGLLLLEAHDQRSRQPLPTHRLLSLAGQSVAFPPPPGRPQVINLWASWCGPCRREMPAFTRVQAERPDVDFLYINIGESEAEVRAFTATLALQPQPMLRDAQARLPELLSVVGYPTTLIVDAEGRLLRRRTGELSDASLRALLPPARRD